MGNMIESSNLVDEGQKLTAERQILSAAMAIIAEKKISGTRMRHIADRAHISQGTIHYYFPTKADLLLAMLDEMQFSFDQDRRERQAEGDLEPAEKIRLFLGQQERILSEYPWLLEIFYDFWGQGIHDQKVRPKVQWMYEEWRDDMEEAVREGIQMGDFAPRHAHMAPALLVSLLEGAALQYLIEHDALDLDQYFEAAYDGILDVLGYHKTRKPYPNDLSDKQWASISPLLPAAKPGGRPSSVDLREVINAIIYVKQCRCSWRMIPHDLPHWQTVYGYYRRWSEGGTLAQIDRHISVDLLPEQSLSKEDRHD